jgi:hypothetical protein
MIDKGNLLKSLGEIDPLLDKELQGSFVGVTINNEFAIVHNYIDNQNDNWD